MGSLVIATLQFIAQLSRISSKTAISLRNHLYIDLNWHFGDPSSLSYQGLGDAPVLQAALVHFCVRILSAVIPAFDAARP